MSHGPIYLTFLAIAALISVAMWIDYFRQIDVFEKEKIIYLLIALVIGGCTPFLSLHVYHILADKGFVENGEFFNDAVFSVLGIGLNEELCKLLGIWLVFKLLKKQIDEPIDFLIYAGITALGFSLVENYNYFYNHGIAIITSRTFYSALVHIINSSIIIYGFYRKKLFNKGNVFLNSITGLTLAVMSHGLFDFFLTDSFLGIFTPFLSLIIYLVGINFWVQMLNNANNYSTFFDYDKINFSPKLVFRLFYWYSLTIIIAFFNNWILVDAKFSMLKFIEGLLSDAFLFWVVILSISRFKIYKRRYFTVLPLLPFYITKNEDHDFKIPYLNLAIKIRGENFQQHMLTKYLNRSIELYPFNEKNSFIKQPISALIVDKYLLFDDVIVYNVVLKGISNADGVNYVLKPKMRPIWKIRDRYPVEGLYSIDALSFSFQTEGVTNTKLNFIEWVQVKPIES